MSLTRGTFPRACILLIGGRIMTGDEIAEQLESGRSDDMSRMASDELMDARTERCDCCGTWGVHVDTDAREIVIDGRPHVVPEHHDAAPVNTLLMTGDADGQYNDALLCWTCAGIITRARAILQAAAEHGQGRTLQAGDAVGIFNRPENQQTQSVSRALLRAHVPQHVADYVADRCGYADAPTVE